MAIGPKPFLRQHRRRSTLTVWALLWCAAGLVEAGKQFRRVNGHMHLPTLRTALERHVAEQGVSTDRQDETVNVA